MHALALIAAPDRPAPDWGARRTDRIEILSPHRHDARAAARRYEETASRSFEFRIQRDEPGWTRRAATQQPQARFLAQFMAQEQPGSAAHVEDWRGARAAYARADSAGVGVGARLSILI